MKNAMQEKWDMLHQQSRFRPKYPSEQVVQFVFRNFKRGKNTRILDLGCGAGRHVYFMASEKIDTYGLDISSEGIINAQKYIENAGLNAKLKIGSVDLIPFDDNFFDGIICYGVLYYCKKNEIQKAVNEIYRVLKKGGKGLLIVRNKSDYRFGKGIEIEQNTFIIDEQNESNRAFNENSMIMHFFERDEVEKLFDQFRYVFIDEIIETYDNGKICDSNFKIIFEK